MNKRRNGLLFLSVTLQLPLQEAQHQRGDGEDHHPTPLHPKHHSQGWVGRKECHNFSILFLHIPSFSPLWPKNHEQLPSFHAWSPNMTFPLQTSPAWPRVDSPTRPDPPEEASPSNCPCEAWTC